MELALDLTDPDGELLCLALTPEKAQGLGFISVGKDNFDITKLTPDTDYRSRLLFPTQRMDNQICLFAITDRPVYQLKLIDNSNSTTCRTPQLSQRKNTC